MRTPDPKVAAKRKRAVELEREGKNATEIAKIMNAKAGTVQKWLQLERGPKEKAPFKDLVVEMLKEGKDSETIVAKLGCSHETVKKLVRENRNALPMGCTRREKRVEAYLADPEKEIRKRYARTESFGRDFVAYCDRTTTLDPKSAKPVLEVGEWHFTRLKGVLRVTEKARAAACNLVQVKAVVAARERALERPENGLSIL